LIFLLGHVTDGFMGLRVSVQFVQRIKNGDTRRTFELPMAMVFMASHFSSYGDQKSVIGGLDN
jgi:hypothetical protein